MAAQAGARRIGHPRPAPQAGRHRHLLPQPGDPLPQPTATSPGRLLGWLLRRAATPVLLAAAASIVANVIQAIVPGFLGAALDAGIENGLSGRVWTISLGLLALFCVYAGADTTLSYVRIHAWMRTTFDVSRLVGRQVTTTGRDLPRQVSTGRRHLASYQPRDIEGGAHPGMDTHVGQGRVCPGIDAEQGQQPQADRPHAPAQAVLDPGV